MKMKTKTLEDRLFLYEVLWMDFMLAELAGFSNYEKLMYRYNFMCSRLSREYKIAGYCCWDEMRSLLPELFKGVKYTVADEGDIPPRLRHIEKAINKVSKELVSKDTK